MKRNVDCIGFDAPEDMVLFMSEALSELQHISPYDSYVDACVKRERENYLVTLSIKHPGGKFSAQAEGTDLGQVIHKGSEAILQQVRCWQKSRFTIGISNNEPNDILYSEYRRGAHGK